MSLVTFHEATDLYRLAARPVVRKHLVTHGACKAYSLALRGLERKLGDLALDESWRSLLSALKNFRFEITAAPVPFNCPAIQRVSADQMEARFGACARSYPQFATELGALRTMFQQLGKVADNPMGATIQKLLAGKTSGVIAMVVKESRLLAPTEEALAAVGAKIEVLVPQQLRSPRCYDQLIVIGPARWFANSEYVFRAPRAPMIDIVQFKWVADDWTLSPAFAGSALPGPRMVSEAPLAPAPDEPGGESLLAHEAVPQLEWAHLLKPFRDLRTDPTDDNVHAKLILLEGGKAVFLEAEEGATSIVIDPEGEEGDAVRRLSVSEMKPGMFVLLRTGGGGDLIIPVADKILSDRAVVLRQLQAEWKAKARGAMAAQTFLEASIRLLDLGSTCANETNLRNWLSPRSIKTQDPEDFKALMKFAGLESTHEKYWSGMTLIDSAHRRAGAMIRRMLLKEVRATDLRSLVRSSEVTFELREAGGGRLTAYKIAAVVPELAVVPVARIARAFDQEAGA